MDSRLEQFEVKMGKTKDNLISEYAGIRAGRANPHILDKITVNYYGAPTPLQQVGNISVPEARMIVIQPWDKSMIKEIEKAINMSDIGINIHPSEDDLVEIAVETVKAAKTFGIDPKVAFLSFSTKGSAKDDDVTKVQNAVAKAKEIITDVPVDGEMQFDAAVSPEVGQLKFPGSPVAGQANTFIFPDITSGNIGYKIAQRMGGFAAYGPILMGLNAPINDLSRGCVADEVYKMAILTCAFA